MEQEKKIRREIANSNERRRMQSINAGFNSLRTMLPKHDGEKLSKAAILQHTAEYIDQLEQDKTRFLQEMSDLKKLLNPELLALHQKKILENESKLFDQQPTFKRIKLEVNSALDFSNSESSDEGIHCSASPKQEIHCSNINSCHNSQIDNSVNKKTAVPFTKNCNKSAVNSTLIKNNNDMNINGNNLKTNENVIDSEDIDELRAELVEVRKVLDRERKLRMNLEEQVRALEAQLYPTRIKEIAHQVQLQFQTNEVNQQYQADCETEAAVTSVIVEDEHEVIAETIEIETHNCPESPNAATLLASTQKPVLSSPQHYSNASSRNNSSFVNNNTSVHTIQDNNFIENTNTLYETEKLTDSDDLMEKILTTPSNDSNNNKQNKFRNSTLKNKNLNNQTSSTSTVTNFSSSPGLFNLNNSSNITNSLKKTVFASPTTTSMKSDVNFSQTIKTDKFKKVKISTPAAIALPIDVPFIYDPNSTNCSTNSNKVNSSSTLPSTTVTVQIIDPNASDNYENVNTGTNNAGRNLDTIVEAIRHLEGDHLFGDNGCINQSQPKKLAGNLNGDSVETSTSVVPIMIKKIDVADKSYKESNKDEKQSKTKKITTYLAVSPDRIIRQQVIKCVSNSSRPGVIVSTNP